MTNTLTSASFRNHVSFYCDQPKSYHLTYQYSRPEQSATLLPRISYQEDSGHNLIWDVFTMVTLSSQLKTNLNGS